MSDAPRSVTRNDDAEIEPSGLYQSHDDADEIAAAGNNNIIDDGESNDDGIPA